MSTTYALDKVSLGSIGAAGTTVDKVIAFNCGDRVNDVTGFSLTLAYDATVTLTFGDVLRLKLGGTVVWCGIIERITRHPISSQEEADQNPVYSGRSLGCLLDRVAVRPTLGFGKEPWGQTRVFGLGDPNADISGWTDVIELGPIIDRATYWTAAQPAGFPGLNVQGIATTGDTDAAAPQGYRPLAKDFTVDADCAVAMFFTADNSADIDLDGFRIASISAGADTTEGLRSTRQATVFLSTGITHRIVAKLVNVPFGGGDPGWGTGATLTGNPCRFAAVGYKVDSAGRLGDKVFETDATWAGLATPSVPPGEGLGQITGIVLADNADLSPAFGISFDDTNDTSGVTAWPILETVATNVGDSLLKLARDWSLLYWLWRFNYTTVELDAWVIDTYTADSGVTYDVSTDPEVSTVLDLKTDQIDIGTDCLIVQYQGAQIRVPASGGTRMGFFKSNAASAGEATYEGTQVLALQDQPEQVALEIAPTGTGDVPGKDCVVGQIVHVADGAGSTRDERLIEWTVTFTDRQPDDGAIDAVNAADSSIVMGIAFTITVKDRHIEGAEALNRHLQRMESGSLGGTAPSAPSGPTVPAIAKVSQGDITFHLQRETIIGKSPAHKTPTTTENMFGVLCEIPTYDENDDPIVTSSDTVVDFWIGDKDGTAPVNVCTVTIPAGSNIGIAAVDPIIVLEGKFSEVWPDVTAAAAEAVELAIQPLTV